MYEENNKTVYFSEADGTMQPALFQKADGDEPRPLVVALHTWSAEYDTQPWDKYHIRCRERNWHIIYPQFRGPNWNSDACGSDLVVSDIVCAVKYMKSVCNVDESKIFLVGGSGGGHASLLLAARAPEVWSAVSAWCPISDLKKWHSQCRESGRNEYADHVEISCSGNPQISEFAAEQARYRSPLTYLASAKDRVILDIGTGIHDGHTGSVPVSQAIEAFNAVADEADRISVEDIDFMVKNEAVPEHLKFAGEDPAYGPYKVLLRRQSATARLTLFEGGHDLLPGAAFGFFDRQSRGEYAVWESGNIYDPENDKLGK